MSNQPFKVWCKKCHFYSKKFKLTLLHSSIFQDRRLPLLNAGLDIYILFFRFFSFKKFLDFQAFKNFARTCSLKTFLLFFRKERWNKQRGNVPTFWAPCQNMNWISLVNAGHVTCVLWFDWRRRWITLSYMKRSYSKWLFWPE